MKITKGIKEKKLLILIYGRDGIGKSSLAGQFPTPLFIGPEDGTSFLDVARVEGICDWKTFILSVDDVIASIDKIEFETIVIDSLDWVEPLIHDYICKKYKVDNLAQAAKGYGAGYKESFDMQVELKNKLKIINQKKNVVLIAHSQVKSFNDPVTESSYDRYELKLHESNSVSPRALWREFVDAILFINHDVVTSGEGKDARASTFGTFLFTKGTPAFDAKRRVLMPDKIKFETTGMYDLIKSYFSSADKNLYAQVLSLAEDCKDEAIRKKALSELPKHRENNLKLKEIQQFLEGKK